MDLSRLYRPIVAAPLGRGQEYSEIAPCEALAPYIRCFWGTPGVYSGPVSPGAELVTPDTCMDAIFHADLECGGVSGRLCALDDAPYRSSLSRDGAPRRTFGVRFYFWALPLFTGEAMRGTLGTTGSADDYLPGLRRRLAEMLSCGVSLAQMASEAERDLLARLDNSRAHPGLMNAIYLLLSRRGRAEVAELARNAAIGVRQLERLFGEYTGASPKRLISLVRYQCLWSDMVQNGFHALEAVERYGYYDQSHLLREFKRYHTMPPAQALRLARGDVAFLQDAARLPRV